MSDQDDQQTLTVIHHYESCQDPGKKKKSRRWFLPWLFLLQLAHTAPRKPLLVRTVCLVLGALSTWNNPYTSPDVKNSSFLKLFVKGMSVSPEGAQSCPAGESPSETPFGVSGEHHRGQVL